MRQPSIRHRERPGRRDWILAEDYQWAPDDRRVVTIPQGIAFDLASVPEWVPRFIADDDDYPAAALIHDMLYRYQGWLPEAWFAGPYWTWRRSEADRLFYDHLRASGCPRWRAKLMYLAVRVGGRKAWDNPN